MSNDENEQHYIFGKNKEEHDANLEVFKNMLNLRQTTDEADEHMRTLSTNRQDPIGMKLHMINSHQFSLDETTWADENAHEGVPRIQHKLSMMYKKLDKTGGGLYPELDHEDITEWHNHTHTAGEFAEDYPSEDTGEEHKHL